MHHSFLPENVYTVQKRIHLQTDTNCNDILSNFKKIYRLYRTWTLRHGPFIGAQWIVDTPEASLTVDGLQTEFDFLKPLLIQCMSNRTLRSIKHEVEHIKLINAGKYFQRCFLQQQLFIYLKVINLKLILWMFVYTQIVSKLWPNASK